MSFRTITFAGLMLGVAVSAFAAPQHHKAGQKKAAPAPAQQQSAAAPQQQTPPQPPPTPEQGPSSPPEVTLRGGQLTILARNSTLGDVLNAVRSKTGASVDMPPASTERVVGQFGPGAPRDVMAQLLNGSHYDYVLVGSPADPGALKKVVLTARASGPEPAPASQNNQPQGYNEGMQAVPQEPDQTADDTSTDVQPEPDQPPPQAEQEEPQGEQPPQPNPGGGPVVKTPEQLLRELQQQQQQQQQQQNPPPQQ